jgi:N-acylneuraminate cytidylyltransferase
MEVLALIPGRGGSKSIPRKNLLPLAGKPLIAHTIGLALATPSITRTVVTTDDNEIAAVARSFGAEVPFLRPPELATDTSRDIDFHRHALEWLAAHERYDPDLVVNLRPTHPVRKVSTVQRAIDLLAAHPEADSLRSIRVAAQSPWKMWFIGANGFLDPVVHDTDVIGEPYNAPRQILPIAYWQDGYVDVVWARVVRELNSTTGRSVLPFVIEEDTVDIDYPDEIAKAAAQLGAEPTPAPRIPGDRRQPRHPS